MSRRREVDHHLVALSEIADIMGSMKMLALMESRKLTQRLSCQAQVVATLERAAADLLSYFPQARDDADHHIYVLFGSERGFCGDFNRRVWDRLVAELQNEAAGATAIVAVGYKLRAILTDELTVKAWLAGASVAEDIDAVLTELVDTLTVLQRQLGPYKLTALYHDDARRQVERRMILPPFQVQQGGMDGLCPPVLNLPARQVYAQLVAQYLFALLHQVAFTSLMAESQWRVEHLEQAGHRLEQRKAALAMQRNALRQEEITEEIEVILLGAGLSDLPWQRRS